MSDGTDHDRTYHTEYTPRQESGDLRRLLTRAPLRVIQGGKR